MRIVIAIVGCLASGCLATTIETVFLPAIPVQAPRAPIDPSHVEIVARGHHVAHSYVELGMTGVDANRQLAYHSRPAPTQRDLDDELRALGASYGCDALVMRKTTYSHSDKLITATCIAYR